MGIKRNGKGAQALVRADLRGVLQRAAGERIVTEEQRGRAAALLRNRDGAMKRLKAELAVLQDFFPHQGGSIEEDIWRETFVLRAIREVLGLEWQTDVHALLVACGVPMDGKSGLMRFNDHAYEVNETPANNWLYHAALGFKELQRILDEDGTRIDTFASVGTGPGLDGAVGYYNLREPKRIILSDVNDGVIGIAHDNCSRLVPEDVGIDTLEGSLGMPLQLLRAEVGIAYGNLPLIPGSNVLAGMRSSSFVDTATAGRAPAKYQPYLLGMPHAFLENIWRSLKPGGWAVLNLGGRVPLPLVREMFAETGYDYRELHTALKEQTQPHDALGGFRDSETSGVTFDFYRLDDSRAVLADKGPLSAEQIKEALQPHRVSATEGLVLLDEGVKIGHIVQVIGGKKL